MKIFSFGRVQGLLLVTASLISALALAEVSTQDLSTYRDNIQQEDKPEVLSEILTNVLQGSPSYSPPSPAGTSLTYSIFASNLSPQQSLTLIRDVVSRGVLTKEQLGALKNMVESQQTTLKKGVEKNRARDLLQFAQLSFKDQVSVCRETKRNRGSMSAQITSLWSDTGKVLSFPRGGLGNITEYADGANYQTASSDCMNVFDGQKSGEDQMQNLAIEKINQNSGSSAGAAE